MRSFTVVARIGENRIDLDDIGDGTQGIKGPGALFVGPAGTTPFTYDSRGRPLTEARSVKRDL